MMPHPTFPAAPVLLFITATLLSACGGRETQVTENPLPPPAEQPVVNYTGPAPGSDDVRYFKEALWDNVATNDRCGSCHVQGQQSPTFARNDDIHQAYTASSGLVNLTRPAESVLVTKVAGGHNCWLASDSACEDIMTTWVENWASMADAEAQPTRIELTAPPSRSPGSTKNFPDDPALFASHVHPLLTTYCAGCHTSSASVPIAPFFASGDVAEAYEAAKDRLNLDAPADSRLVVRVRDQFHNCWSDCQTDGAMLADAIQTMAAGIPLTELSGDWVYSDALGLFEGVLASGGGRFDANVIAKWEFKTGSGNQAFDTSGVDPALDLTLSGEYSWVGGYGIQFGNGKAQGSTTHSQKLYNLLVGSGEFALEAWVAPANVTQEGPARIISYSGGRDRRNFTLGQQLYNYTMQLRTDNTDVSGDPMLVTDDDAEVLQAALQHVVVNFSADGGRQLYVNGQYTGDSDEVEPGNLLDWDDSFAFVLGNEVSGDRPWAGTLRMVAVHNRPLSEEAIASNFDAGVGQQYLLLFGISHLTDVPTSYVMFEVSQYDSYSYLFSEPRFISLQTGVDIEGLTVEGMRIGINGRESFAGQVFSPLQAVLSNADYTAEQGALLSRQGTIVPVEKGPENDEFFLTFDRLGDAEHVRVSATPPASAAPQDLPAHSDIGVRHFAEINASMAQLTGVAASTSAVNDTFRNLQQQLPSVTDIESYVAANQMAVTQLAIRYCDTLIENGSLRSAFFPDFDFNEPASTAFAGNASADIITPLLDNMLSASVTTQADRQEVANEIDSLITRLAQCNGTTSCDTGYTRTIAKASCAAVLGSAVMLIQ
ncbi:LamG domain-containing protein [Alteromonas sp. ASW11-19]|uniref:LamG domain-containing protein n=1 Tax=Alteromonas salexigens TaxID=2982530 RepID=A0ABT2VT05_9ALTE|nr:LamG domain-containing protein [Alteromonas salexigens]MCU7556067.1 LamG domain-containing protein [Alteromonas salexigens]